MNLREYIINNEATILDALKAIDHNKNGFVIVENEGGGCVGVLTDGDIRRAIINGRNVGEKVSDIVRGSFSYIRTDTELATVVKRFEDEKIKFIPVLDAQDKLVNIIKKKDLYTVLIKDVRPDVKYDFSRIDPSVLEHDVVQRPWGFFKTTVLGESFRTKIINVRPKAKLSLQSHNKREEYWVVVKGNGAVTLDESEKIVSSGSIVFIPKGCKLRIWNTSETESLIFIEVQQGDYLEEDDIIRYEDSYGRI
jgi:mannose-1-phosphate guanylyltransferase/mannose-6-phosphate isomerase